MIYSDDTWVNLLEYQTVMNTTFRSVTDDGLEAQLEEQ